MFGKKNDHLAIDLLLGKVAGRHGAVVRDKYGNFGFVLGRMGIFGIDVVDADGSGKATTQEIDAAFFASGKLD